MIRYRQAALDVLYVVTEAVVWFMALRVVLTLSTETFWRDVARNLARAISAGALEDPERAREILPIVQAAAESSAGPSLLLVVGVALAAFGLERGLARTGMDGALGAVALLLGSILALNIVFRLALGGDWRVWDLAGFVEGHQVRRAGEVDLELLVAQGGRAAIPGSALAFTLAGLTLLWVRFLIAARSDVAFPRVLRSVSVGLAAALVAFVIGAIGDVEGLAYYVLLHFVLGVLALAVANNARAYLPAEGDTRGVTPWLVAVSGTVAVLLAVASVVALLAFLNAGVVLSFVGGIAVRIIEVALYLIITPLYWAMDKMLSPFLSDGLPFGDPLGDNGLLDRNREDESGGPAFPGWVSNLIRTFAVIVLIAMLYYLARLILGRRQSREASVAEVRARSSGGASFTDVLRDILPEFRRQDANAWMRLHPLYRLYGRVTRGATDRGFHPLEGETPLEFTARASSALTAPFEDIGSAFDRARYGRHFPPLEDVRAMEQRVAHWEREVPVTRALRESLQGAEQMSESDEITLRIERRRAALRGDAERVRRLGEDETR